MKELNIVLTELGNSLKDDAKTKGISILNNMLDGIQESELHSFLETMDKLCSNMTISEGEL